MDLVDVTSRSWEAIGPLSYEADSFSPFVFISQDQDASSKFNVVDQRRKMASELLEVLESSQADLDEPYSGWLEEPMDLDVFGQSLEQSSGIPLDEVQAPHESSEPSNPLGSEPLTPLTPTSPQELYAAQDDYIDNKLEPVLVVPDNEELMASLESLLVQFDPNASLTASTFAASPLASESTDYIDADAALLESLLADDNQLLDELAEITKTLMPTIDERETPEPQPIISTPSITLPTFCFDSDSNSICSTSTQSESTSPRRRGRKPKTAEEPYVRKPRSKITRPEEKRLRKMEQNKTAATRYRMKKKAELDLILEEEAKLEERNRQLQSQHDELATEIRYLKKLFREIIGKRQ